MIDTERFLIILVQAGSFIAAFAAIAAGIIMVSVTKKFGTGLLSSGFKTIGVGVFCLAGGIVIDAITTYLHLQIDHSDAFNILVLLKIILFVLGTYIIVIGSKKTIDKLSSLTK